MVKLKIKVHYNLNYFILSKAYLYNFVYNLNIFYLFKVSNARKVVNNIIKILICLID